MPDNQRNIPLNLIYQGESYAIVTYANEYYSLMTLISERLPVAGFGLCNGMGSCGTCIVTIGTKYSIKTRKVFACDVRIGDDLSNT